MTCNHSVLAHCGSTNVAHWILCSLFFMYFKSILQGFFVCFVFFRAIPAAYESSQAKGRVRAKAAVLHHNHSNVGSKLLSATCTTVHSQQHWILNPLSKTRDWTLILMDTGWVHYHWATMGTPHFSRLR